MRNFLTLIKVYDISILSGIPASITDLLPLEPLPTRLRPFFSVGVHDMQTLAQGSRNDSKPKESLVDDDMGYGWVACSTDDILTTKEHLYDTLITIPPSYTAQAVEKVWPQISSKRGTDVKATQRDLRRYRTLRRELHHHSSRSGAESPSDTLSGTTNYSDHVKAPLLPLKNTQETFDDASSITASQLTEPQSWSALAYSSFMWWASAGEKRTDLDEEAEHDSALLRDFGAYNGSPNRPRSSSRMSPGVSRDTDGTPRGMLEMAIIAYFHRLTALMLGTLSRVVDDADDDAGSDVDEQRQRNPTGNDKTRGVVFVASEDMARMGLDIWSEADRRFVKELVDFYWGRKAEVQGARVECCGVRIC